MLAHIAGVYEEAKKAKADEMLQERQQHAHEMAKAATALAEREAALAGQEEAAAAKRESLEAALNAAQARVETLAGEHAQQLAVTMSSD